MYKEPCTSMGLHKHGVFHEHNHVIHVSGGIYMLFIHGHVHTSETMYFKEGMYEHTMYDILPTTHDGAH